MTLSFDQFKSTPEFSLAFEDLGNVSTATLEHLMAELKKYGVTAAGTMKLADFKEYAKTQKAIFDQLLINDPFKALKESVDELKIAEEEMTKAHQDLLDVQNNKPVITGYKPTKGWEGATSIFPSKQVFGEQSSMLPKVGTKNVVPPTAIPILLELGEATTNATVKDNQFTEAQKNVVKSTKAVDEKIGELSKNLSSVGAAIGGTAGEIISSIGDIGSFVTSAITGWETASTAGSAAIQTVEKASVILAVISAVITVATKIVSIFTSASKKRKEEAQAELDSIEAVKKAYLDAYATMIDKKFSNIFGDDVFGKATAQIKLMNQAAGDFKDNVVLLAKGDNRVGTIAYDILGRSKTLDIANFDIVKAKTDLARKSITDSEKTILQSLVDDYEAYQSYLDEIDSYLSSIFGQLGSNIMDSLVTDQDNMTKWADDVTGYISDSFTKMVKDIIYNMDFAETLSKEQKIIKGIMADTSTTDAQKEAAMQAQLILFKAQLVSDGTKAAADWKTYSDAWTASGMGTLGGASTDTSNSTVSAIKGMDQPTADILTAQFSALRIHGANMDVNISKININVSDLLLSLQGQTSILQIAFNDVAEIARNTRDLAGIKSILSDMKTYGLKAL